MNKKEFMDLPSKEQFNIMSRIYKDDSFRKQVKIAKEWFYELLESQNVFDVPHFGLCDTTDAKELGLNIHTGKIEAEYLEKGKHYCPKATKHLEEKNSIMEKIRGYREPTLPMGGEEPLDRDTNW